MGLNDLINVFISLFILGIGSTLVTVFIKRSFKSSDSKISELEAQLHSTTKTIKELEKELIKVQEFIKHLETIKNQIFDLQKIKVYILENYINKDDFADELEALNDQLEKLVDRIDLLYARG